MKVISFGSLKGGTGKSSLALLTARRLASAGFKVLGIDLDINNSFSFALSPAPFQLQTLDPQKRKHIAAALQSTDLKEYIIPSNIENLDLIRSSLYLVDLRTISTFRLKTLLKELPNELYDYVIIDTAPTYDNIVMGAYEASDCIITPVLLNQFDYNTANFLAGKLRSETSVFCNWKIIINQWNNYCNNTTSAEHDYVTLFSQSFNNILQSKIPQTKIIKSVIDRQEKITNALRFERLKTAIDSFVSEITGTALPTSEGGF